MLTVSELISILENMPQDLEVKIPEAYIHPTHLTKGEDVSINLEGVAELDLPSDHYVLIS